jgi:hypothetical protein
VKGVAAATGDSRKRRRAARYRHARERPDTGFDVVRAARFLLSGIFAFGLFFASTVRADLPAWAAFAGALDVTPHGTQPGLSRDLLGSQNCGFCHNGADPGDENIMPSNTWGGSMMANATRDPVFWAALDVANNDGASIGVPNVGEYCLRCHTPKGWYANRVKPGGSNTLDGSNGCLLRGDHDDDDTGTNDYGGVSCHFCHRLMDQGPQGQPAYLENANAWLDDGDCNGGGEPCRRGPYTYPDGKGPPHAWAYSSYHESSEICGLCHNVTTPDTSEGPLRTLRDASGVDTGVPFPIERTFSEWKLSDFGDRDRIHRDGFGTKLEPSSQIARAQECQHCHMPNSDDPVARACIFDAPGARTGNLATHQFVGGNAWVPNILKGQYGQQLEREFEYNQTMAWARAMLAASAEVQATRTSYVAPTPGVPGSLGLAVKVINLSGHKLPTGYGEGRRMWLNVKVTAGNGATVFESGAYDATTAVLTTDAQAKVYEIVQGIWDPGTSSCRHTDAGGNKEFHFVLNNCVAKDNRIPPLGFTGGTNVEVRPVGYTYPTVPGSTTLVNYDVTNYTAVLPAGAQPPFTVLASLHYQTSSREYIEFLRDEAVDHAFPGENTMCSTAPYTRTPLTVGPQAKTRGQYLYDLWNDPAYGKSPPELVDNSVLTVN